MTALVSVVSSGLVDAAVPTGCSTIAPAEPGPEAGTPAQAGPKMSFTVVTPLVAEELGAEELLDGADAEDDEPPDAAVVVVPPVEAVSPLLQAAMVKVRAASAPTAERRWVFFTSEYLLIVRHRSLRAALFVLPVFGRDPRRGSPVFITVLHRAPSC
ncbi:hypothetical protein GCM10027047_29320 [Rhodococcus aerolatus]